MSNCDCLHCKQVVLGFPESKQHKPCDFANPPDSWIAINRKAIDSDVQLCYLLKRKKCVTENDKVFLCPHIDLSELGVNHDRVLRRIKSATKMTVHPIVCCKGRN